MDNISYNSYYGMMSDSVRVNAYRKAIQQCVKAGDVVVDVGAGIGLLTFMCLQAGARKVYSIEERPSIHLAKETAQKNHFHRRIEFIEDNSKTVTINEKVDVIVSETLGSFGIDENTIDFLDDAISRFLKPQGVIIPKRLKCFISPVSSEEVYNRINFWKDIGGIDYSLASNELLENTFIHNIEEKDIISHPLVFCDCEFSNIQSDFFSQKLTYKFTSDSLFTGFAGWFKVDLCDGVSIDTCPGQPKTHWKHAFYALENPIEVKAGEVIICEFKINPKNNNPDESTIFYDYSFI